MTGETWSVSEGALEDDDSNLHDFMLELMDCVFAKLDDKKHALQREDVWTVSLQLHSPGDVE